MDQAILFFTDPAPQLLVAIVHWIDDLCHVMHSYLHALSRADFCHPEFNRSGLMALRTLSDVTVLETILENLIACYLAHQCVELDSDSRMRPHLMTMVSGCTGLDDTTGSYHYLASPFI